MVAVAFGAALGIAFLYVLYRAVEFQWPASYFAVRPGLLFSVSQSPVRYGFFRLGPMFLTATFLSVSIDRADENALAAVLVLAFGHAALTTLKGLRRELFSRQRNMSLGLFYVALTIAIFAAALAGHLAGPYVEAVIPPLRDLSASLWTALVAGVIGAYIVRVSHRDVDSRSALLASRRAIPPALWDQAEREAVASSVDPNLVLAIMLVENLERPRWARRLERWKGRILRRGSYGIMQVSADVPLSDEESISLAIRDHLANVSVLGDKGWADSRRIEAAARSFNNDAKYAETVRDAYFFVQEIRSS